MPLGVSIQLFNNTTQQANIGSLMVSWWDETDPVSFKYPIGTAKYLTTNSSGYLNLDLSSVSALTSGDDGYLLVHKVDTNDYLGSLVFSGIVTTSTISSGTVLSPNIGWERPEYWEALPSVGSNEIAGLFAVFPTPYDATNPNGNLVAFSVTVVGGYTVDWGDGSAAENVASAVVAEHSFKYSSCSDNDAGKGTAVYCTVDDTNDRILLADHTFTDNTPVSFTEIGNITGISVGTVYYVQNNDADGFQLATSYFGTPITLTISGSTNSAYIYACLYRQAIIKVTRQNTGNAITAISFISTHSLYTTAGTTGFKNYGWLDLYVDAPSATTCTLYSSVTTSNRMRRLQQFQAPNLGVTNFQTFFSDCYSLKSVPQLDVSGATNAGYMFRNCYALERIPSWFNNLFSQSVTTFTYCFQSCYSLKAVPSMSSTYASLTSIAGMFETCSSLEEVGNISFPYVTTATVAFSYCNSLEKLGTVKLASTITDSGGMWGPNSQSGILKRYPVVSYTSNTTGMIMHGTCGWAVLPGFNRTLYTSPCMGADSLNNLFRSLGNATYTIDLQYGAGSADCDTSIATAKGWTVINKYVP
jgi:hypothetical protein